MQRVWNWVVVWMLWPIWLPLSLVFLLLRLTTESAGTAQRGNLVRGCWWLAQLWLGLWDEK